MGKGETDPNKWRPGARSTRSLLPGETDNEEAGLMDEPDDGHTRSRPGSAPRVLVRPSCALLPFDEICISMLFAARRCTCNK